LGGPERRAPPSLPLHKVNEPGTPPIWGSIEPTRNDVRNATDRSLI